MKCAPVRCGWRNDLRGVLALARAVEWLSTPHYVVRIAGADRIELERLALLLCGQDVLPLRIRGPIEKVITVGLLSERSPFVVRVDVLLHVVRTGWGVRLKALALLGQSTSVRSPPEVDAFARPAVAHFKVLTTAVEVDARHHHREPPPRLLRVPGNDGDFDIDAARGRPVDSDDAAQQRPRR